MKSVWRNIIIILLTAATITSCSKQNEGPPTLVVDRFDCARCKMLISDTRYACAFKLDKYSIYDDIGCMLDDIEASSHSNINEFWFRDYNSDTWISAKHTLFFLHNSRMTPMGYGYIAIKGENTKPLPVVADATYLGNLEQLRTEHAKAIKK